jgi:hypothetical protein
MAGSIARISTLRGSNTLLALTSVELPFGSSQNPARHPETIRLNPVASVPIAAFLAMAACAIASHWEFRRMLDEHDN